ncbi:MAG: ABC transporter permease, partial [candidate division Zixibacteria bacterium]|nr:ABC transporter permease [candidate division Zixibacteria bacterium]
VGELLIASDTTSCFERRVAFADPSLFDIFSFPLASGDSATALSEPRSVLLTEKTALKYFGADDPTGEVLRIADSLDFVVTGVIRDLPVTSHLQFDFLLPFAALGEEVTSDWHNTSYYSYLLLQEGVTRSDMTGKISDYLKSRIAESTSSLYLQPLTDIHLHSGHLRLRLAGNGDIRSVYLMIAMALVVLVLACVNYVNLATARSQHREKEIGVRKTHGAPRMHIVMQFLTESMLLSFVALIVALTIVELLLEPFGSLLGRRLTLDFTSDPSAVLGLLGLAVLTGILSGGYPALFLSSFPPIAVLKSSQYRGSRGYLLRKGLVVFQFALATISIAGVIVVYGQMDYISNRNLGFNADNLIHMRLPAGLRSQYVTLKSKLQAHSSVLAVTAAASLPSWGMDITTEGVSWDGKEPDQQLLMRGLGVDYNFFDAFGMEVVEGRPFSREYGLDTANYILNQAAVKAMGIHSPVGKRFTLWENTGTIVGIVKDYNYRSLHSEVQPLLLRLYPSQWLRFVFVRIRPDDVPRTIEFLRNTWHEITTTYPFEYGFVDDLLGDGYATERSLGTVFTGLAVFAVLVACLGVIGLVSLTTSQRRKEIAIRKVVGASTPHVCRFLLVEIAWCILLSGMLAAPVTFWVSQRWLENFAYHVSMRWWMFVLSAGLALLLSISSVIIQTMKAARANPVEALKYE